MLVTVLPNKRIGAIAASAARCFSTEIQSRDIVRQVAGTMVPAHLLSSSRILSLEMGSHNLSGAIAASAARCFSADLRAKEHVPPADIMRQAAWISACRTIFAAL